MTLICWSVLGQGQTCRVDPRFNTPGVTLVTYWEALRSNDVETVRECFADPDQAEPEPGTLWFLPPSSRLSVCSVRFVPIEVGRLLAAYQVRFLPLGDDDEREFEIGTELVRVRGEWRIARAAVGGGMPEWRPMPRQVDI